MSQLNLALENSSPTLRPRTRREKIGIALSLIGFFGSITALAIYGISGYNASAPTEDNGPTVIFAGGAPTVVGLEDVNRVDEIVPEDEAEEGDFGQPASEFFGDDDEGGWGSSAIESSSGQGSGDGRSRTGRPREGRIGRGTGGAS